MVTLPYLLVYDRAYSARLTGSKFYKFKKLLEEAGAQRIQYSVYLVPDLKAAQKIALFLGPENCHIYELATTCKELPANIQVAKTLIEDLLSHNRKMFTVITKTWNPVVGCSHNCRYCWSKKLVTTRLKNHPKYAKLAEHWRPILYEKAFKEKFKPGEVVFTCDMGDLFCDVVPDSWIHRVLDHVSKYPDTWFLFLTKNPDRYKDFLDEFPRKALLGATIETDDDNLYNRHRISFAPTPTRRLRAMINLRWHAKFISVEPILDFTSKFADWLKLVAPALVYIGYDNYNNNLPEPPLEKTLQLIKQLKKHTFVITKTLREAKNLESRREKSSL